MRTLRARRDLIAFVVLAVTVRLAFWLTTNRVWEDALITLASPRNAIEGLGLTHHPGEPVTHAFTSALGVLIPLAGEAISAGTGLLTIRVVSLVAAAIAIVAADALGRHLSLDRPVRYLVMGYLALDFNQIFYGMTGMETQVAVAALLVTFWATTVRHPLLGVALGVALLARPDFVILAGAIGLPLMLHDRRQLGRAVAGAAIVTIPWLMFTTWYYGSPIPQSILAKSMGFTNFPADTSVAGWLGWIPTQTAEHVPNLVRSFAPFLQDTMAFAAPLTSLPFVLLGATALVLVATGMWVQRSEPQWWPLILFVLAYAGYKIFFLPTVYFDWYLPPFTATSAFLIAAAIQHLTRERTRLAAPAVAIFLLLVALPLPWHFEMERTIQAKFEDGVRTPVSQALQELVPPGEGVASESAGYIGWFSRVTLNDFPGLTSKRSFDVVRALPREERGLQSLIDRLQPPWAVLRPFELAKLREEYPETASRYVETARFGVDQTEIEILGFRKFTIDSAFTIVHRVP